MHIFRKKVKGNAGLKNSRRNHANTPSSRVQTCITAQAYLGKTGYRFNFSSLVLVPRYLNLLDWDVEQLNKLNSYSDPSGDGLGEKKSRPEV